MTKKDYQAIAAAIHHTREFYQDSPGAHGILTYMASKLADVMKADNGRFDPQRFIEACETGRTKGMRQG